MQPSLVDWWAERLFYERQARDIAHQQRLVSAELLAAIGNRPQNVINLQRLHERVYELMGVKP